MVPTAITRPPFSFVRLIASTVFWGTLSVLGVHVVRIVGIFGLHYAEGVEPYFEVHGFEANTLLLKAFDKLRGEMEPCCGSSCALLFA